MQKPESFRHMIFNSSHGSTKTRSKLCFGNITAFMLISSRSLTQNSDGRNAHISYFLNILHFSTKNAWYISVPILMLNLATDRVKHGATDGHLISQNPTRRQRHQNQECP